MSIKFWSEAYCFQAWRSLTSLKYQTRDPQLKVPPGGHVLRIFTSWKNPMDLSRVWTREPWISRRARYPETTEANLATLLLLYFINPVLNTIFLLVHFIYFYRQIFKFVIPPNVTFLIFQYLIQY